MFLKKIVLIGSFALISLPLSALALTTINTTNVPSTVRITTSPSHLCSNINPRGITQPGQTNVVDESVIRPLCFGSPGKQCGADVYMTNNCTGPVVKHGTLDLNPGGDITLDGREDPNFVVRKTGHATITLSRR